MIFNSTDKSLRFQLAVAAVTNPLACVVNWIDMGTLTLTPGSNNLDLSATTVVVVLDPPAAGISRILRSVSLFNADTIAHDITVLFHSAAMDSKVYKVSLAAGGSLCYTSQADWHVREGNINGPFSIGTGFPLTCGSIELGDVADNTFTRTGPGRSAIEGKAIPLSGSVFDITFAGLTAPRIYTLPDAAVALADLTSPQIFTGKRYTRRTGTVASSATPVINTDTVDVFTITALATTITSMSSNLSGTPTAGQELQLEIMDDGTTRAITWGASFENSIPFQLPTQTVPSTKVLVLLRWNSTASKWKCVWTSGGIGSSVANQLVWDGDSHTAGADLTVPFPTLVVPTDATYTVSNTAVSGSNVPQMSARAYANVDSLFQPQAGKNVVIVQGGGNDMAGGTPATTAFLSLVSYCLERKKKGWHVIVGTMYSRIGLDTQKNSLNALLRAKWPSFADGLIDYAAVPELGADGAYANGTYFQSSGPAVGVHLKDAGASLAASRGASALENAWLGPGRIKRGWFKADKNSVGQTGILPSTWTKVTFPNVVYNSGAFYDATNSRWTTPYGLVRLWATALFTGGTVDQAFSILAIYKNGVSIAEGVGKASGTDLVFATVMAEDISGTNDYYEVYANGQGAGNKTISGTITQTTWFGETW